MTGHIVSFLKTIQVFSFSTLYLQGNGTSHFPPSNVNPEFLPSQELHFIDSFVVIHGVINNGLGKKDGGSREGD